ncbi:hypothetical protein BSKO_04921 [Bryopsis sp. KO-2023]|nr:hypothetical protein BSKO_04921 [Bryopsis sp. KO-2023]
MRCQHLKRVSFSAHPRASTSRTSCRATVENARTSKPDVLMIPKRAAVVAIASASLLLASPALADKTPQETFDFKCAGCHINGGNVLGGPTLKLGDLEKNGVLDSDAMFDVIYSGKGKMPGFGQDCAPKGKCTFGKRLSDEMVSDLGNLVVEKAKNDWQ